MVEKAFGYISYVDKDQNQFGAIFPELELEMMGVEDEVSATFSFMDVLPDQRDFISKDRFISWNFDKERDWVELQCWNALEETWFPLKKHMLSNDR